jgi:hypothetical protein
LLKSEFSLLSSSYFCLLHVFEFLGISWVEMKNTFSTPPWLWVKCGNAVGGCFLLCIQKEVTVKFTLMEFNDWFMERIKK